MKSFSVDLKNHIKQEVTSLSSCWKIIRTDGVVYRFTDHDQDLTVDGEIYAAADGYNRSALKGSSGTDTDEMELAGFLQSDALSEKDLKAGLFDYAEILFFLVNWQAPDEGIVPLRKGWIGQVTWSDDFFQAELRGLTNALKRQIGAVYTPECQADLGDGRCKVNLSTRTFDDEIVDVVDARVFRLKHYAGPDLDLTGGVLSFVSGRNSGRHLEIDRWHSTDKKLSLFLEAPFLPAVGDLIKISHGCDKRYATCRDRFQNIINFRGFPHVPGTDALLERANG